MPDQVPTFSSTPQVERRTTRQAPSRRTSPVRCPDRDPDKACHPEDVAFFQQPGKRVVASLTNDTIYYTKINMSSNAKKLFSKWSLQIPKEARINDVKTVLKYFFPDQWDQKGTSHIVIRSEKLKAFEEFKPYGEITVPVKSGKHVKGFYIKTIIKGIELLQNTAEETNGK